MDMPAAFPTSFRPRLTLALRIVAVAGMAILAACSSSKKHAAEKPTANAGVASTAGTGGFVTGGAIGASDPNAKFVSPDAPKFSAPKPTGKGAPDLASVPDKAPKPPSSRQDREKVTEGLVADRDRARYTDQGGRSAPLFAVAVHQNVSRPRPAC